MRIVRAEILEYVRPLDGRSWNPVSRWTERRAPLLVLETDDGIRAQAEAWSKQAEIRLVFDALEAMLGRVIGASFDDADAIASLFDTWTIDAWPSSAAASAIDMALWDALSRTRQRATWQSLGGSTDKVRVYASGGLYRDGCDARDLAAEIVRYRHEGFRDIKIKVGGRSLDEDVGRIAAARHAMVESMGHDGPVGELWVDAVNQLTADNAAAHAIAHRNAGATAIQAPVSFDDHSTMSHVGREALPVIAGEATFAQVDFERLLDDAHVGFLQLNLGLCGGFTGADRVLSVASSRNVPVTVQAHGTAILLLASMQWGAARNVHGVEFHRFHDHLHRRHADEFDVRDGIARLMFPAASVPTRSGDIDHEHSSISSIRNLGPR